MASTFPKFHCTHLFCSLSVMGSLGHRLKTGVGMPGRRDHLGATGVLGFHFRGVYRPQRPPFEAVELVICAA